MKNILSSFTLALFALIPQANSTVHLSNSGTGQVLVFPYYTVAEGLNTYVSIDNSSDQSKAIKIHIKESKIGASVATFNLYLNPQDIWTMGMGQEAGMLAVVTNDQSCTLNFNESQPSAPISPGWNWQTGTIEVIEMGSLDTPPNDFTGADCETLSDNWFANGPNSLWQADGNTGLTAASGGLKGTATVINVDEGFSFSVAPLVFEHFFEPNTTYHTEPSSTLPDLSSGSKESLIIDKGQVYRTTWPTGYEAVSALLMKSDLTNEFNLETQVGAKTEWIISFPTWHYHRTNDSSVSPFNGGDESFLFPSDFGGGHTIYNRESGSYSNNFCGGIVCPPPPYGSINHSVNTYVFSTDNQSLPESIISGNPAQLDNVQPYRIDNGYWSGANRPKTVNGKISLWLSHVYDQQTNDRGINSLNQMPQKYFGLPVIGFAITAFYNSNAQPGKLATYTTSKAHYGTRQIQDTNEYTIKN